MELLKYEGDVETMAQLEKGKPKTKIAPNEIVEADEACAKYLTSSYKHLFKRKKIDFKKVNAIQEDDAVEKSKLSKNRR